MNVLIIEQYEGCEGSYPQVYNLNQLTASTDPLVQEAVNHINSALAKKPLNESEIWDCYDVGIQSGILEFAAVAYPCMVDTDVVIYSSS